MFCNATGNRNAQRMMVSRCRRCLEISQKSVNVLKGQLLTARPLFQLRDFERSDRRRDEAAAAATDEETAFFVFE